MLDTRAMLNSLTPWPFSRRNQDIPDYVQHYLDTPRPDEQSSWRSVPYSVLDIETTGFNARYDAILSIGLVEVAEGRIHMDRQWYTLVRPPENVEVSLESIRIHGLMRDELARAPRLTEVMPDLLERIAGRVLVVHYAPIDVDFLNRAMRSLWSVALKGPGLDTILLAQTLHRYETQTSGSYQVNTQPATALSSLSEKAGLPMHQEHNALGDALTTAQLFLAQATRMEKFGFGSLRKLLRAGRCLR